MTDTATTETTTETATTGTEGQASTDTATTDAATTDTGAQTPTPEDELPEWARKELTSVRGEAANYRTQLRTAQDALSKAKTPEEFEAATTALNDKVSELERSALVSKIARKHELPDELADVLKGDDEAALVKHALSLQKFAGSTGTVTLSGGLSPEDEPVESDPRKLARVTRR